MGERARESARAGGRALLYETDALVCERARGLLRAEGFASCAVDCPELFVSLCAALEFELYVIGVTHATELAALELDALRPLVVLARLDERATHYRVALAHAVLVDRELRDPDALRRALGSTHGAPTGAVRTGAAERAGAGGPPRSGDGAVPLSDPVRLTFEPFGLSDRQLEVLRLALLGQASAEIGSRLFISELTVRNHLHAIYERIGVSGRRELLGRFVRALVPEASARA